MSRVDSTIHRDVAVGPTEVALLEATTSSASGSPSESDESEADVATPSVSGTTKPSKPTEPATDGASASTFTWGGVSAVFNEFTRCDRALREAVEGLWQKDGAALVRFVELLRLAASVGHPRVYDRNNWTIRRAAEALDASAYSGELNQKLEAVKAAWIQWDEKPSDAWACDQFVMRAHGLKDAVLTFDKASSPASTGTHTKALLVWSRKLIELQYPRIYVSDPSERAGGPLKTFGDLVATAAPSLRPGSDVDAEIRALGKAWRAWCEVEP